ncbi:endonuclease/exonuclease/phosphatase family protein [Micromonospora sp. NPDC126480]|uniref:endonuclease/exonuclease/phosphatase family protein n=1 Tax=Micromonospora sp. NPDC126480 TaxID=3155312 RepID=UPI0033179079
MRNRHLTTVTLALGVLLLTDVLRVFLPAVITIFGQAASTPAELLGAFALGWFVLALGAPPLVRRLGARSVALVAAVALAVLRLAVVGQPGGGLQLWLAAAGLFAGLVWLAAVAARTDRPVPGWALGLVLAAVVHTALDTYRPAGVGPWIQWLAAAVPALLFVALHVRAGRAPAGPGGVRGWLLAGPVLLLAGMVALSPAVARTASTFQFGLLRDDADGVATVPLAGAAPVALSAGGFLLAALAPPRGTAGRWLGPVTLLAGAVLFAAGRGDLLLPAVLLTAVGLGGCLALAGAADERAAETGGDRSVRRGYAVVGGMLVFAVAAVLHYAAYDLGYPNAFVPVAVAVLVAGTALAGGPPSGRARPALPPVRVAAAATALALVAALATDELLGSTNRDGPPERVRVVAYNIRMGFGMDGRFDPDALARVGRDADVVVLGEVDRGWLLNGGHDTLDLLAERLDMPYVFAPAADPLWGDAVLSRWPLERTRTRPLPAVGAPTGAQVLGTTLDLGAGVRLAIVGTHLQPPPGREPVVQAREVTAFALDYADGLPLVVAGDLNTEPGAAAFAEFTRAGLVDALASARPLPTSPSDEPRNEIDHVFVTPGLTATDVAAPPGTASDHLPVAVTLTLP